MNNVKNSVRLIGRLGNDPELKDAGKTKLAKFSLATNDTRKDADGNKIDETEWHNLVVWGKPAETAAKYLKKGSEIAIEGKLTSRSYDDKDGVKHYVTEVVVREFSFLGKKTG
ncbi:MAG: single-stranded DNA-binding protein [Bacteroidetes bacterium]|nr:MAG: single-stranded DNA-binding protein [Bacteroidota bacterium]